MERFLFRQKIWEGRVWEGISRDYFIQNRRSKHTSGDFLGYKIIPSHPHKYTRSKQGLNHAGFSSLLIFFVANILTKTELVFFRIAEATRILK
jgi:hypothetical protein